MHYRLNKHFILGNEHSLLSLANVDYIDKPVVYSQICDWYIWR